MPDRAKGSDSEAPEGLPDTNLRARARAGARYTLLAQVFTQFGSVVATALLARLLTPSEFGMVAATQSVVGFGTLFTVAGLSSAILTRKGSVERLASTYFWLLFAVGSLVAVLLSVASGPVAQMVGAQDARGLIVLLSLSIPFALAGEVPRVLIQRKLRFLRLAWVSIIPPVCYFAIEIVLAFAGYGALAVILGQLVSAVVALLLGLVLSGWAPVHRMDFRSFRGDLPLAGSLSAVRVLEYGHKNVDYWAVSRSLGAGPLGQYYVAYVLPNILRLRLSGVFRDVMLPVITSSSDPELRRRRWTEALGLTLFISVPVLVGTAAVAEPLVALAFGAEWKSAVGPMRLIALSAIADIVIQAVATFATAERRLGAYASIQGARLALTALTIILALSIHPSLLWVAGAVLASSIGTLVAQHYIVARPLGLDFSELRPLVLRVAAMAASMGATVTLTLVVLSGSHPAWSLSSGVIVGVASYLATGFVLDRTFTRELTKESLRIIR